jgi:hypothetical protein
MKVFDLFSKRQKQSRGEVPDVYQYKTIPDALRVQIVHIIRDAFGDLDTYRGAASSAYKVIHDVLCREYGVFRLSSQHDSDFEAVVNFLLQEKETEKTIDVIELTISFIDRIVRKFPDEYENRKLQPDDAIAELNHRFREHGVGFQYESGTMIRVDSQLIHAEVVRPALSMLADPMYEGANAEFLSAHEHYRTRKYKECLNDCLKAFESTLKAICTKRGWVFGAGDTAKRLLDIVFANELIPTFMQTHFGALRSSLEAGVPTVRNRLSGHGQGAEEIVVPESVAAYVLHLTAANVLLLTRAHTEMK